jgi:hypothetical protein
MRLPRGAKSAGTIIWTFRAGFDYVVDDLPQNEILGNFVLKYGYRPITGEKVWVMCADDARFFNHSDRPAKAVFGAQDRRAETNRLKRWRDACGEAR